MKGGCHCRAIRFEIKKKPYWVGALAIALIAEKSAALPSRFSPDSN